MTSKTTFTPEIHQALRDLFEKTAMTQVRMAEEITRRFGGYWDQAKIMRYCAKQTDWKRNAGRPLARKAPREDRLMEVLAVRRLARPDEVKEDVVLKDQHFPVPPRGYSMLGGTIR